MDRLNSHFLRPSPTAPETSLVTVRALWLSSWEFALADLVYSLAHIRYHPGIVQQAKAAVLRRQSHPITTTNLPVG
jgi:hypothetical protein